MTTMTLKERQSFLAEERIGVLTVQRPTRAPLAVPIWYSYQPDGELKVWTTRGSVKERLIGAAGRISFTVHDDNWPYRYVTAEGPVVVDVAPSIDDVLAIAARYLPEPEARSIVEDQFSESSIMLRMRPERWLSVDYTKD